ncbi:hypothetical protein [Candidatus Amarobacter glycogenicus]|uniref:hypothetical protein n=1 Tax=Candidatus Amarobacter glycogenicus TaxID=3140699 RepID=UPI002A0B7B0B|nr:hypothetical protein [Dehalococcoidia bacterium]
MVTVELQGHALRRVVGPFTCDWQFSRHEVAYLLRVPLDHLRDRNLIPDRRVINGREYEFQSYQFGEDLIWGATARMLIASSISSRGSDTDPAGVAVWR